MYFPSKYLTCFLASFSILFTILILYCFNIICSIDYTPGVIALTLFRMGGMQKVPPLPTSFSPITSTNVGISPKNLLTFSFIPFPILV